jgi:hypothetical protein
MTSTTKIQIMRAHTCCCSMRSIVIPFAPLPPLELAMNRVPDCSKFLANFDLGQRKHSWKELWRQTPEDTNAQAFSPTFAQHNPLLNMSTVDIRLSTRISRKGKKNLVCGPQTNLLTASCRQWRRMWETLLLSSIQQALVTDRFVACVHLLTLLVRDFCLPISSPAPPLRPSSFTHTYFYVSVMRCVWLCCILLSSTSFIYSCCPCVWQEGGFESISILAAGKSLLFLTQVRREQHEHIVLFCTVT